ncbi:CRISPR-associated helicase Cas3' [Streptomyces sp. SP18CS02]|uniref:CRISPR-associated helicase Cas3' n=1 Tax=Streptomyces sp. SP18CS02 TaxID=3002531 RepID=UPI002E783B4F|nr:CRISPR-associated helicase Cas3' [Streptomyces sp. SP18CS02]MEE1756491.1 CRISPR-associated helicase Cas3' [Streptomyces sp. SP18CS02]
MVDARVQGKSEGLDEPYPVVLHLVDTAFVCGAVWDLVLSGTQRRRIAASLGLGLEDARAQVMFWAGLHDLGKITPQFQDMILKTRVAHRAFLGEPEYAHDRGADSGTARLRHEYATHAALPSLLIALGYPQSGRPAALLLTQMSQVLGGHHGRYPRDNEPGDLRDPLWRLPELGAGEWAEQRKEHVRALYDVLGRPPTPTSRALPVAEAVVLAGVVIVSDWIASQEHVISDQQKALAGIADLGSPQVLTAHAGRMERLAPALLEDAGLGSIAFRDGGFRDLFPGIATPHPLQLSVEKGLTGARLGGPGILLVTAPTGEGKTETALYAASVMGAASGSGGVFFALPTQATANQMYGRLVDFARRNLSASSQLTLLHGAADLYAPYAGGQAPRPGPRTVEPRVLSDHDPAVPGAATVAGTARTAGTSGTARTSGVSVEAGRWLRSRGRGILAPLAVGTIDQALMGVLPLKRNALRHLGLSGKTVVIDEAHAYDAYTHALMLRLLEWLGALGVPVVLLSATLTGDIARGALRAYLSGADPSAEGRALPTPSYPGWVYASADGTAIIEPAAPIVSEQRRALDVEVRRVRHTYDPAVADGRIATLLDTLEDVADAGGCAAVICTTVAEAQQTFDALRAHYRERYGAGYRGWDDRADEDTERRDASAGPRLRLLHARFPARRRASITAEAESWFGRTDKPQVRRPTGPRGAVLVATQVIEQSLDLDFDVIVSDLAPMAMLLQRAGRIWRHRNPAPPRPAWAHGPRLVVLAPVGEKGEPTVPRAWGEVYTPSLLHRTFELLAQREGAPVAVPEDVQGLVDGVYAEDFPTAAPERLMERDFERLAEDMARTSLADMVALPPPRKVTSLHSLTTSDADEELVRTRLGAESVQVLPVFEDEAGRWLDEGRTEPLPESGSGPGGRFTVHEVRELLGRVAPLAHGAWRASCGPEHRPPASWSTEPRLARLVLLPHRFTGEGRTVGATVGDVRITYDHALGLVTERLV